VDHLRLAPQKWGGDSEAAWRLNRTHKTMLKEPNMQSPKTAGLMAKSFAVLALFVASGVHAQTHGQRFAKHGDDDKATFCISKTSPVAHTVQHVAADQGLLMGQGKVLSKLQVHKDAYVRNLSALKHGDALYFVLNEDFGGSGGSKLCKTSVDGKTMLWCKPSGSFNAELSAHQDGVYVSSVGGVAKFDAQTGKTLWQQQDLYDKDNNFAIFKQPLFEGGQVKFVASATGQAPFVMATVDDATGKIALSKVKTAAMTLPPDYAYDKTPCVAPPQPSPGVAAGTHTTAQPATPATLSANQPGLPINPAYTATPIDCAAYDKPNKDISYQLIHCPTDRVSQVVSKDKRFDIQNEYSVNTPWADIARTCKRYLALTQPHSYSCQDASKTWVALFEFAVRANPEKKRGEARDVFVWVESLKYATCASPDSEAEFQKVLRRFGKHDEYREDTNTMVYHSKGASDSMWVKHTNKGMGGLGAVRPHPNPRARMFDHSNTMINCPGNYSLEFTIKPSGSLYTSSTDYFKSLEHKAAQGNKGTF
jgi:hypothetical protein